MTATNPEILHVKMDKIDERLSRTETKLTKLMVHMNVNPYYNHATEVEEQDPPFVVDVYNKRIDLLSLDVSFFTLRKKLYDTGQRSGFFEVYCNGQSVATLYLT